MTVDPSLVVTAVTVAACALALPFVSVADRVAARRAARTATPDPAPTTVPVPCGCHLPATLPPALATAAFRCRHGHLYVRTPHGMTDGTLIPAWTHWPSLARPELAVAGIPTQRAHAA